MTAGLVAIRLYALEYDRKRLCYWAGSVVTNIPDNSLAVGNQQSDSEIE
jgi:hypothetical protein